MTSIRCRHKYKQILQRTKNSFRAYWFHELILRYIALTCNNCLETFFLIVHEPFMTFLYICVTADEFYLSSTMNFQVDCLKFRYLFPQAHHVSCLPLFPIPTTLDTPCEDQVFQVLSPYYVSNKFHLSFILCHVSLKGCWRSWLSITAYLIWPLSVSLFVPIFIWCTFDVNIQEVRGYYQESIKENTYFYKI